MVIKGYVFSNENYSAYAPVLIKVNKTHSEGVTGFVELTDPILMERVLIRADDGGKFNYTTTYSQGGMYEILVNSPNISPSTKQNNTSISVIDDGAFFQFTVMNIFYTMPAKMVYLAIGFLSD